MRLHFLNKKGIQRIIIFISITALPGILGYSNYNMQNPMEDWGFFAHKYLNKLAVFTLPDRLIEFYKKHIDFLTEHAVDPDKRRYALRGEAIRHYIDLDNWGDDAAESLPRSYEDAIIKYAQFYFIQGTDTTLLFNPDSDSEVKNELTISNSFLSQHTYFSTVFSQTSLSHWIRNYALRFYDDLDWLVPHEACLALDSAMFKRDSKILIRDYFSSHGILPYSLPMFYQRLVQAFKEKNTEKILKLSADIGHYIGDAHVPLHTTKNYNGQLTNQDGIHAFWESRIPELFAEESFDFVVGASEYIPDFKQYVWKVIKESHSMVDSVLFIEKRLSQQFPLDQQYCYENRLGSVTKLPCRNYAAAYNRLLDNQVEQRFRECILAIGSCWMSAWTEAGQPDLGINLVYIQKITEDQLDSFKTSSSKILIRDHE